MDGSDSPPPPEHGTGAHGVTWSTPARTSAEPYAPGSAASKVSESTLGGATARSGRSLFDSQDVHASIPTILEHGEPVGEAASPMQSPSTSPHPSPERKKAKKAAESDSDIESDDNSFNSWERGERPFDPKKDCPPLPSKPEDVDYATDDDGDIPHLSDKLRAKPCLRLIRKILSKRHHLENFRADAQYQANIDIIESNDKNAADILEHFMSYTYKYGQMDFIGDGDPVTVVAAKLPSPEYSGHYRRSILIALKAAGANFDNPGNDGYSAYELIDEVDKEEYADICRAAEQKNRSREAW